MTEACRSERAGGYIVRTAAQGATAEAIRDDIAVSRAACGSTSRKRGLRARAGELVYEDLPLPTRILRDELARGVDRVLVDNSPRTPACSSSPRASCRAAPPASSFTPAQRPIFDLHGVEEEIEQGAGAERDLKSGGHLVIDQTEAMTTIDVNTGGFVGHRNLEDTIFRTNLEAAVAIARQLGCATSAASSSSISST